MSFRTPLSSVRGLGSARDGTHHWIVERVTALALIPLSIWLVVTILCAMLDSTPLALLATIPATPQTEYLRMAWPAFRLIHHPLSGLFTVLFLIAMFIHSRMGVQVIIEDYVHRKSWKFTLLLVNSFIHYVLLAMSVFAAAKLYFLFSALVPF